MPDRPLEEEAETRVDVARAIRDLPLGQKKVVIAVMLGEPMVRSGVSNPSVYMDRAIRRLRPRLAEYDPSLEGGRNWDPARRGVPINETDGLAGTGWASLTPAAHLHMP